MAKPKITPANLRMTKRHLPHWQVGGSWYFVTFRVQEDGLKLPHGARNKILDTIFHDDGKRYDLSIAVVMPDHVHLLLKPKEKIENRFYPLSEILALIKGVSARAVNKLLGRSGSLWQDESFDRIIRNEKEWREKYEYVMNNPVKARLVKKSNDYDWLLSKDLTY